MITIVNQFLSWFVDHFGTVNNTLQSINKGDNIIIQLAEYLKHRNVHKTRINSFLLDLGCQSFGKWRRGERGFEKYLRGQIIASTRLLSYY